MTSWTSDDELFDLMASRLYTAVVSDILDHLGHRDHAMSPEIRALEDGAILVGRAMPMRVEEVAELPQVPYRGEIAAIDDLRTGEIAVVAAAGTRRAALWGELFSNAARARRGRGAVLDGYVRDRPKIRDVGFPVFARGTLPLDCNGRTAVVGHREPATCGGLLVHPGDVVFGDEDGIVVIPERLVEETTRLAFEKASTEDAAREAIRQGALLREAFERYRVL